MREYLPPHSGFVWNVIARHSRRLKRQGVAHCLIRDCQTIVFYLHFDINNNLHNFLPTRLIINEKSGYRQIERVQFNLAALSSGSSLHCPHPIRLQPSTNRLRRAVELFQHSNACNSTSSRFTLIPPLHLSTSIINQTLASSQMLRLAY